MTSAAVTDVSECSALQSPTGTRHTHHRHPVQHAPPELRPPPARYSPHTSNFACLPSVPSSKPGKWRAEEGAWVQRPPRNSVLCRLLAGMIALLVFIQAVSCGLFFCVQLPFSPRSYVDYRDLISELDIGNPAVAGAAGESRSSSSGSGSSSVTAVSSHIRQQVSAPKLIPRVIHQTYHSTRLPASAKQFMRSWQERNGDAWQVRLYSDEACLNFVRREFPEYFEAYMNLPKEVERADFFRYMVILRLGGVYADIDVECRQPLDSVIQPADTLLVGWDVEMPDTAAAAAQQYARQRQVANWFFAAAPGHPVLRELCDHIAHNAMTVFSNNTVRDTLERTGQGIWTDLVLRHALQHPAAKHDDPWKVRILPRVAFSVHPSDGDDTLGPHLPGVVVLHHFLGRWQWQGSWARRVPAHRKALQIMSPLLPKDWVRQHGGAHGPTEPIKASNTSLYPVSVDFYPPFTMMVDLVGAGDKQADVDVSAAVTAFGAWQPAVAPYRRPAVVEALVGALSRHSSSVANSPVGSSGAAGPAKAAAAAAPGTAAAGAPARQLQRGVLVDVGAGHGFFSLAAAAGGHRVVAFETSPGSLAAFKASIAYNGFGSLIDLRSTVLGAAPGTVCLQQHDESVAAQKADAASATDAPAVGGNEADTAAGTLTDAESGSRDGSSSSSGSSGDAGATIAAGGRPHQRLLAPDVRLRMRRGYSHLTDSGADMQQGSDSSCAVAAVRQRLSDVLSHNTGVAVLRVSAHGHEGFIIQGAEELLRAKNKPDVVYIEFCPAAMRAAGYKEPKQLLQQLFQLGYTDIAHAGRVCDRRWFNVTHMLRLQGTFSASRVVPQQPTWCKLRPEHFQMLVDQSDPTVPENVLFVLGHQNETAAMQQHSSGSSTHKDGKGGGDASQLDRHSAHSGTKSGSEAVAQSVAGPSDSEQATSGSSTSSLHGQLADSTSDDATTDGAVEGAASASAAAAIAPAAGGGSREDRGQGNNGVVPRRMGGTTVSGR